MLFNCDTVILIILELQASTFSCLAVNASNPQPLAWTSFCHCWTAHCWYSSPRTHCPVFLALSFSNVQFNSNRMTSVEVLCAEFKAKQFTVRACSPDSTVNAPCAQFYSPAKSPLHSDDHSKHVWLHPPVAKVEAIHQAISAPYNITLDVFAICKQHSPCCYAQHQSDL